MICSFISAAFSYLLPFHITNSPLLILHLFFLGISGFAITSLLQAYHSSVAEPSQRDILLGLFFTIGYGLSSVWSALMGFVIDLYGSFGPAYQLMAILSVIGAFVLLQTIRLKGGAVLSI